MGPLSGIKIVEFAGIGPAPFCAMVLADLGATVLRIDRKERADVGLPRPLGHDLVLRNRKSIRVDLKQPAGLELALALVTRADALIEGFRPGVMERLGLGPKPCRARNPRLIYGRATGWGQEGPLSQSAGHDINYIAVTGFLNAIGRPGQAPSVPLNIADYAAGSLYLALGILAGVIEARTSGAGQVIDAAVVDGMASLLSVYVGLRGAGMVGRERGTNILDSGAPFYEVYECADGQYVSIGPIEQKFYRELLHRIDLEQPELLDQMNSAEWPKMKQMIAAKFRTRPRAEWTELLEGTDVCFAPVLDLEEAFNHPHLRARQTFIEVAGVKQPAPAPRFSRTPSPPPQPPAEHSFENSKSALRGWLSESEIADYAVTGAFS